MKYILKKTSLPVLFEFILFISLIETVFFYFFELVGLYGFKMIPYLRLVSLLFTFIFFFKKKFIKTTIFKVSLKSNSENVLILVWVSFSFIGFVVGILRGNAILYLFTDIIYILFGYFLYRIFSSNQKLLLEMETDLTRQQELYFLTLTLVLAILAFVIEADLPSFLVVFTLVLAVYHFQKRNYALMLLYSLPFFFQILRSNRALLVVFIFLLFFAFAQNRFSKKNIIDLFLILGVFIVLSFFLLDDFLKFILQYFTESSNLKSRLVQLYLLLKGNINWNSPTFLSLSQRIDEAKMVVAFWCSNPFNFIFGGGMGATIEGFSFRDAGVANSALLGKSSIHNIHILPFALIFRYGIVGVGIFFILIHNLVKYLFKIILSKNIYFNSLILFQFCWIIYSIPAASYLWTCPLFWITLAYISNEKRIFST